MSTILKEAKMKTAIALFLASREMVELTYELDLVSLGTRVSFGEYSDSIIAERAKAAGVRRGSKGYQDIVDEVDADESLEEDWDEQFRAELKDFLKTLATEIKS